jgi:REP element-mobilizing transposase RayT
MPDHVHLLVSVSKERALSDLLRTLKANSSRWIHETYPDRRGFAWQAGYGAFSVSNSGLDPVRGYIASQAEHHRRHTFQEEFVLFLQRHGIAFDERYLWE